MSCGYPLEYMCKGMVNLRIFQFDYTYKKITSTKKLTLTYPRRDG